MSTLAETLDRITADELRARGGLKWTEAGPGALGAFVAEMDFGTAPAVTDALTDSIRRYDFGYLRDDVAAEMADACATWYRRRYGWDVDAAHIHPLPDVVKGLEATITTLTRPGSPIILPTPAYMPFLWVPAVLGREVIEVPMVASGGRMTLDLDGIDAAYRAGGHLLVLCNPCNPVGRVYEPDELAAVSAVVERHGGRVFSDEIHAPLVYPGHRHVPYASLSPATAAHTVTATSASKAWNLPGLKCAQILLTSPADIAAWESVGMLVSHGASTPGVRANTAAYRHGGDWLDEIIGYLDGNRRLLGDLLAEHLPEVGYTQPEGTYLAWLDCRDTKLGDSPAPFFRDRAGVVLNDGPTFGAAGRGHVRLNMATPRPILTEIVHRMAAALHR